MLRSICKHSRTIHYVTLFYSDRRRFQTLKKFHVLNVKFFLRSFYIYEQFYSRESVSKFCYM